MTGRNLATVMTLTPFSTCIIKKKKKTKQNKSNTPKIARKNPDLKFKLIGIDVTRYSLLPQDFIYHSLRKVVEMLSFKEILCDVYTLHFNSDLN